MHDIVICGAGPVGLYLASLLEKDFDVLVVDKNRSLGKKADSGLYSVRLLDFVPLQKEWVEHEVKSALVHSPNGETITLKKQKTAAYVVSREKFTMWLGSRLKRVPQLQTDVTDIIVENDGVTIKTNKGEIRSKMIIGCDGASSRVRKHWGVQPKELLNGVIAITTEKNTSDQLDIYVDKTHIPDGFFWKIPRGETTEYGALGKKVTFAHLEKFFPLKTYEKHAAFMNIGLFQTAFERTLLVGEAAGQVKPWSLGGIIFGFTCAHLARDTIVAAFAKKDFSSQFLQQYDAAWKAKIGKTITFGMMLRDLFEKSDNERIDNMFKMYKKLPLLSGLDMDFPEMDVLG